MPKEEVVDTTRDEAIDLFRQSRGRSGNQSEQMQTVLTGSNESSGGATAPSTTNVAISQMRSKGSDLKAKPTVQPRKQERKSQPVIPVARNLPTIEYEEVQTPTHEENDLKLNSALENITPNVEEPKKSSTDDSDLKIPQIGRWNYNMQYGIVSPIWEDSWRANADEENRIKVANDQARAAAQMRADAANARAKQIQLGRIKSSWDTTLQRIERGKFDHLPGGKFDAEAASAALRRLAQAYADAGGNVNELAGDGLNRGGYKARSNANYLKAVQNESIFASARKSLFEDLNTVDTDGTIKYLKAKNKYDPIINRVQAVLSGSGSNMADADKIRVQYLYLPPQRLKEFTDTFGRYVSALANIARAGSKPLPQQKINNAHQSIAQGLQQAAYSSNFVDKAAGLSQVANSVSMMESDLMQLGVNAEAVKEAYKAYVSNLVMNADIDPQLLNDALKRAQEQEGKKADEIIRQLGGRRLATESTLTIPKGKDEMFEAYRRQYEPNSPRVMFPSPSVPKRLQGSGTTTNNLGYGEYSL